MPLTLSVPSAILFGTGEFRTSQTDILRILRKINSSFIAILHLEIGAHHHRGKIRWPKSNVKRDTIEFMEVAPISFRRHFIIIGSIVLRIVRAILRDRVLVQTSESSVLQPIFFGRAVGLEGTDFQCQSLLPNPSSVTLSALIFSSAARYCERTKATSLFEGKDA
jgi:hypothetical protein